MRLVLLSLFLLASAYSYGQPVSLLNGKDLSGWEVVGNGIWSVMRDGTLVGQRDQTLAKTGDPDQSWLYTKKEYTDFDLHLEFWVKFRGNSGVSIRDTSRGRYSFGPQADPKKTPSNFAYEIQIINGYKEKYPTGSVYHFQAATTGMQLENDWNSMDIESRKDLIRVRLNGQVVAEHPGDPARPKTGPIGLQLHDQTSLVMFRNVTIVEK